MKMADLVLFGFLDFLSFHYLNQRIQRIGGGALYKKKNSPATGEC